MPENKDSLFLLEVLVDKVTFEKGPCYPDREFSTCVTIEAATMEPLEICDDEGCLSSNNPFVKNFNCGKSCLFSLKEAEITSALSKFPIICTVAKKLPCGCLPSSIVVGNATIDMTKEFTLARQIHLDDPTAVSYQALKDSFAIKGPDGNPAGEIMMFLRISCFGNNITTKFQGSGTPGQGILGGAGAAGARGSCTPQKNVQTRQSICSCSGVQNPCRFQDELYNQMPCEDDEDECRCCGQKKAAPDPVGCRNTDPYCLHLPRDCCPPGNKIVFRMPAEGCLPVHKARAHFQMDTDGKGEVMRDDPTKPIIPHTADEYQGVKYQFDSQVLKLRIGKYVETPQRSSKFEYQFITPAPSSECEVITRDTRTAQCLPTCKTCCPRRCCR